jgi:hypothetical protein
MDSTRVVTGAIEAVQIQLRRQIGTNKLSVVHSFRVDESVLEADRDATKDTIPPRRGLPVAFQPCLSPAMTCPAAILFASVRGCGWKKRRPAGALIPLHHLLLKH